ncbi:MAG: cation transporting ATPase C-terminal domain-containing protein, partial [Paramuribaculum sp.]|nr:cation transporting ATPase C-terminal domain-containing protein [Paramuribaculum sp.]
PLTVTQMLWVNIIMDTFAAMALASLPPSRSVMKESPRPRAAFIINRAMRNSIIGVGVIFFVLLLGFLYYLDCTNLTSLTQIGMPLGPNEGLSPYELSVFFTVFVFLQFWNMFNAKAFATGRSALHFKDCRGFNFIATCIFVGQILIVECGGPFFSVVPLSLVDWIIIIASTSTVLWIGELMHIFRK